MKYHRYVAVIAGGIVAALLAGTVIRTLAYSAPGQPLIPAPESTLPISTVPQFGKFEGAFTLTGQSGNPFDPDVNKVDVLFHCPSLAGRGGEERAGVGLIDVPAFWDGDVWKVRFSPPMPGRYTLSVVYNGVDVKPVGITSSAFKCLPSKSHGYVRLDSTDVQRFIFDDGTGFYPIGLDQAWTNTHDPEYPIMFSKMHDAHLNFARVWMTFWDDKALDWAARREDNPKISYYYLPAARRIDMLMDAAAQNGVYVQLCLQHHGQYTATTDPNWADNPANAANGGYLRNPGDFFTDYTARRLTRAKYRYIVARWGYSTHLMSYELFNEVQNIREMHGHEDAVAAWHKEMAQTIRAIDYAHHLITTSTADDALRNCGLDYDQWHVYSNDIAADVEDAGGDRPGFVGEFGPGGGNWGYDNMKPEVLHDGLWAGMTAADAGAPQFWYWDIVNDRDWWPTLKSAALFYESTGASRQLHLEKVHAHFRSTGDLADVVFSLPGDWKAMTQSDVDVPSDGSAPDAGGTSGFIQGSNHQDMMPKPITFHIDAIAPTTFRIGIAVAAKAGTHAVLLLDGQPAVDKNYPAADADQNVNDTLSVDVPAGSHTVTLGNTGFDWFKISTITLTHFAPSAPYAIQAKGNDHFALFRITPAPGVTDRPSSLTLAMPNLKDSRYAVHFWSTTDGHEIGSPQTVTFTGGSAAVSLPSFDPDVAGWIELQQ